MCGPALICVGALASMFELRWRGVPAADGAVGGQPGSMLCRRIRSSMPSATARLVAGQQIVSPAAVCGKDGA